MQILFPQQRLEQRGPLPAFFLWDYLPALPGTIAGGVTLISPGPVLTCSAEAAFSLWPQGSEEQPLSHLGLLHQLPGTGGAVVTWLL